MASARVQRGFVRSSVMDLAFLFLFILFGLMAWQFFSTVATGDFALVFFMVWLVASALGWWWSRKQPLLLRVQVGFLVYLAAAVVLMPLSWWAGNKVVLAFEAAFAATLPGYVGGWLGRRLQPRLQAAPPWYLDQRIDLVADLFRWAFASGIAWFVAGVVPLLLVFVLPVDWIPKAALAWALAALFLYLNKYRKSRMSWLNLAPGIWTFVIAAALLWVFQREIAGPLEPGSIGQIAYLAYAPLVAALFVEIVVLGTPRLQPQAGAASPSAG